MNGLRRNDAEAPGTAGINQMPSVAIVILNWNGKKYLEQFLPFVLAGTYANQRVIVADNASTDDSVNFLRQHFPAVELLINPLNEGFAKGYNTALKQVQADYYVLLNNDVEVAPGWIEPVINLMQHDTRIAACQPKILSYHQRDHFEYAGACGGWLDNFGYPFARGRVFDAIEKDNGQYDDVQPCFWATGAAMFVRAVSFHAVGRLDEYFFAHQEEIDLCWRLQLAGHKVYVQPASVVYHIGGGTLAKEHQFKTYLNFRNSLVMCAKNLTLGRALWIMPVRLALDALAAWKELFGGNRKFFMAVVRAHLYFIKWLFVGRHLSVKPASKQHSPEGMYKGAVVWDYFVKGKKSFHEIVKAK